MGSPAPLAAESKQSAAQSTCKEDSKDVDFSFECYLKWIREYLPMVPQHLMSVAGGSEEAFMRGILEMKPMSQEEENMFRRVTDLCWKLNMASQYVWLQDFESAFKCIKMAKEELDFHVKQPGENPSASHIRAYEYAIDSSIASLIQYLLNKYELSSTGAGRFDTSELAKRWEDLNLDVKSKAVIAFLKACLMGSLRIDDKVVLDKLKEAAALEPDFHAWYRYIYRKIRNIRRSDMRRNLPPGDDEKDACKKAFSLRSDLGDNISNMAGLREEELRFARRSLSPEEVNKTLKLLTDLLESSPSLATDPWVKIRLAEIYGLRDYNLDPSHGEELFKECIEQWPLNTMVWHKAAKFYHLGGSSRGEGPFVNYEKAKEYYKKSLKLRGSNFPCLMDYLKLLRQPFDAIDEMADEIDRYLPMMKNENEIRRLLIIKGILLWIHYMDPKKRTQACYTWLTVIKKFPSAAFEVGQSIKSKRNEVVGLQDINTLEINELLKKMLDDMEVDESFHKPINMLMSELSRAPRTKDSNNGPRGNQVNNGSRANQVTNGSRANQVNDGSRANQVNDGPRANELNNGPRMKEAKSVNDEVFKEAVKKVLDNPKIVRKPSLKEECKVNTVTVAVPELSTSQKDSSPPVSTASATSIKTDLSPESEVNTITVAVQDLTTSPKDSSPPVSTTKTDLSPEPINATNEHISALEAFIKNNTSSSSTPLRYASRGRGRRFPPPSSINDP